MNSQLIRILILAVGIQVTACAVQNPTIYQNTSDNLDQWVEGDLIPYAVKQLSAHPKFKGQSLLVVSMEQDRVQPEIDELTRDIRQRLVDALLKSPGTNLVWHPGVSSTRHHLRLDDITCVEFRKVRYYVGLDIDLLSTDSSLEVSLRALDLVEKNWVSGFHRSWRGSPTRDQRQAVARRQPDEYLRGHRLVPFTDTEPDLLAARLAQDIGCLLRHKTTVNDPIVYVKKPSGRTHPYFRTAVELVDNYLNRFRDVEVTHDPQRASVILSAEIHRINNDLYQVWLSIINAEDGRYLPGTETAAYVRVKGAPIVAAYNVWQSQRNANSIDKSANFATFSNSEHKPPLPLIESFQLLTPLRRAYCDTRNPWEMQSRIVKEHEHLSQGMCLAVEVSVRQPIRLFVAAQSSNGKLIWIIPSPCGSKFAGGINLKAGERFRYPLPERNGRIPGFEHATGDRRIYAIAFARTPSSGSTAQAPQPAPTAPGLCKGERVNTLSRSIWQTYLHSLASEHGNGFDWRTISF